MCVGRGGGAVLGQGRSSQALAQGLGTDGCEASLLQAGTDAARLSPHPPARPSLPQAQRWPFQSLGEWETRAGLAFREESRRTSDKESKGHGNNSSLSRWAIASLPERTELGAPPGQPKTNRAAGSSHAPRPEPPGASALTWPPGLRGGGASAAHR